MPHKFDPAHMSELDREDRREWQDPRLLLNLARVRPGLAVADIGCGIGFFAIPAAERVGDGGLVYAVDVEPKMIAEIRRRVRDRHLGNVRVVRSRESKIPLPDTSVDVAWTVNTFHEFDDPSALLSEIRRLLRPGGSAFLVDWKPIETPMGPPLEVRVPVEVIEEALESAGFTRITSHDVYPFHNLVQGRRSKGKQTLRPRP